MLQHSNNLYTSWMTNKWIGWCSSQLENALNFNHTKKYNLRNLRSFEKSSLLFSEIINCTNVNLVLVYFFPLFFPKNMPRLLKIACLQNHYLIDCSATEAVKRLKNTCPLEIQCCTKDHYKRKWKRRNSYIPPTHFLSIFFFLRRF